jgi:hypothetical protein
MHNRNVMLLEEMVVFGVKMLRVCFSITDRSVTEIELTRVVFSHA